MSSILALGPAGTNAHEAAKRISPLFPGHPVEFCGTNREVLERVCAGESLGVVPVENGSVGYVGEVIKFWLSQKSPAKLKVIGELTLPIEHHLLVHSSVESIRKIKEVVSHPQALEQCMTHIRKLGVKTIPVASTAEAARYVARSRVKTRAAIGSAFAAQIYRLKMLHQNIEDSESNATCFHIVGYCFSHPTGNDKTAVLFRLPGKEKKHGAIVDALLVLKEERVNMSMIHSIPLGTIGKYAFYCEFDCHAQDEKGKKILRHLKKESRGQLLVLGSFSKELPLEEGRQ